jgi:hypothetical protein
VAMSFVGATVKEAYVTLLDLAVVLQLVPFVYVYLALVRLSSTAAPAPLRYSKRTLRVAGLSGLATTGLGMVVAFVPSHQIDSVVLFEMKMILGCALFLGLAMYFYQAQPQKHNGHEQLP